MIQKILVLSLLFGANLLFAAEEDAQQQNQKQQQPQQPQQQQMQQQQNVAPMPKRQCSYPNCDTISPNSSILVTAVGQGVAPSSTISPAQAKAMAKRAAIADAYRQIAEKVNGVKVEGRDFIRNMVAQRSEVRTCVQALIKNASVVESRMNDGLYEVEMELRVNGSQWYDKLSQ